MKGTKPSDWPERYQKQIAAQPRRRNTPAPPNLEQHPQHEPLAEIPVQEDVLPCRIGIHSIRRRLADVDNLCGKYFIDGLMEAGILRDDSPEHVKEVTFTQEKGEPERTIITLTWEDEK
jgi:Holliday junction resolvase RusA-like endonuclease